MSKILTQFFMLQAKTMVNAYTWTTLPLYTLIQRPWNKLRFGNSFNVNLDMDPQYRIIYQRPSPKTFDQLDEQRLNDETFAQTLTRIDPNREVVGIRDVIKEWPAIDSKTGEPITIEGRQLKKVELAPQFRWLTVAQVMERVDQLARGFRHNGINKGDHVLIYAENSLEWFLIGMALARLNAVVVTLFSTLGDSGVVYGINQSDAKYIITSQGLLPKLLSLTGEFEQVKSVIYIDNINQSPSSSLSSTSLDINANLRCKSGNPIQVLPLSSVEQRGATLPKCDFPLPSPDDVAVIMYTSGTTGDPKGVLITHKQLYTSVKNMLRMDREYDDIGSNSDHVGYLPMAHMFGYVVNLAVFSNSNGRIGFCSPLTLFDFSPAHVPGQVGDIKLIRPKFFVAVPLVLERVLKEIYSKLQKRSPLAAPLFTYLMDYKIRWRSRGYDTPLINRFISQKINEQFGGQLRMIAVSSAPLNERTQQLIEAALDVKVILAYGSTENCGPALALDPNDDRIGYTGVPYHSFKYYLKDWPEGGYSTSDRPNARGEIVLGGDAIAQGYYKMPEETAKSFTVDEDGTRWYHTGDIGELDTRTLVLKIIDRKKDITKLANGEFVSLGKIESCLRNSPFVDNICVCVDSYSNHVTALITPNRVALNRLAMRLFSSSSSSSSTNGDQNQTSSLDFDQLCTNPTVITAVHRSLIKTGKSLKLKSKEIPAAITLISEEWSQENNLLTAAYKLRRKAVYDRYRTQINSMFANTTTSTTSATSTSGEHQQQSDTVEATAAAVEMIVNAATDGANGVNVDEDDDDKNGGNGNGSGSDDGSKQSTTTATTTTTTTTPMAA